MKIIGLTGGIGSGKSTVAKMFSDLGIPVYIADDEAKKLMLNQNVKNKVIDLLGDEAYQNNKLNRSYVAAKVFQDPQLLEKLNSIIHPEVGKHFKNWLKNQDNVYVIKEAAILFENGNYKHCDKTVLVVAGEKKRIDRVVQRDKTTIQKVLKVIENQWTDNEKIKLADFLIENNSDLSSLRTKVYTIHEELMKLFTEQK
jgi:dephospho-CoA kinase